MPVLVNAQGQKLSKQALAPKIDVKLASQNLIEILSLIDIELAPDHPRALIDQTLGQFDLNKLMGLRELRLPSDQQTRRLNRVDDYTQLTIDPRQKNL